MEPADARNDARLRGQEDLLNRVRAFFNLYRVRKGNPMLPRLPCQDPGGCVRFGKDYNIRRSGPAAAVTFCGAGSRIAGRKILA